MSKSIAKGAILLLLACAFVVSGRALQAARPGIPPCGCIYLNGCVDNCSDCAYQGGVCDQLPGNHCQCDFY